MTELKMMGKTIQLELSAKAENALANRTAPLFVEMELYFSCLLRKQVRIYEELRAEYAEEIESQFSVRLANNLNISFRPVMTKSCSVSSCDGEKPPVSDFPIEKPNCYVPKWLKIDFRKGQWHGNFGY